MKAVQTKQQNEERATHRQWRRKKKKKLFRISDIYSKSKGKKKRGFGRNTDVPKKRG